MLPRDVCQLRGILGVMLLAGALMLAGCSTGAPRPGVHHARTGGVSSPSSTSSPVAQQTGSGVTGASTCAGTQLTAALGPYGGSGTGRFSTIYFRNTSTVSCSIGGHVGFGAADTSGKPVTLSVADVATPFAPPVEGATTGSVFVLRPGDVGGLQVHLRSTGSEPCTGAQLSASAGGGGRVDTNTYADVVVLVNHSGRSCSLSGYMGITREDQHVSVPAVGITGGPGPSLEALLAPATADINGIGANPPPFPKVSNAVLPPGGTAYFEIVSSDNLLSSASGNQTGPCYGVMTALLTPPFSSTAATSDAGFDYCTWPIDANGALVGELGHLTETPVYEGAVPSGLFVPGAQ